MMSRYASSREARTRVVLDTVEHVLRAESAPLVVDLGSGPGTLARRLARHLPAATVIAVDHDPFLLALGASHPGPHIDYVHAHAGGPAWTSVIAQNRLWDVVTADAVLHYPSRQHLEQIYRDCVAALRPGGLLLSADHLPSPPGLAADLAAAIDERQRARAAGAVGSPTDEWTAWWDAASREPVLAPAYATHRTVRATGDHNGFTPKQHEDLMRAAGFRDVATLWSLGTGRVLVAVR